MQKLLALFFLSLYSCVFVNAVFAKQFLVLADLHFGPFISCQSNQPCPIIDKLRHAPSKMWPAILQTLHEAPSTYKQDTNYALLKSTLTAAQQAAIKNQATFVIVLGDFLAHDYQNRYRQYTHDTNQANYEKFVAKTYEFLQQQLALTFPHTNIYVVMGNNDSFATHYTVEANGTFFKTLWPIWSQLFSPAFQSMQQTFLTGGYYALTIPNEPNIRLIILNSVFFSPYATGHAVSQAAQKQLTWLQNELAIAKQHRQKALIAMHIPFGVDVYATLGLKLLSIREFWQPYYVSQLLNILAPYNHNLMALFSAHLHADWFQSLYLQHHIVPVIGTPAVSPQFGNNPSFKVYRYDGANFVLQDSKTFYNNLETKIGWKLEYDFHRIYDPNCATCKITTGINHLGINNALAKYFIRYYAVDRDAQPITTKWDPYYWCAIYYFVAKDYRGCINDVSNWPA